jgi:Cu/Ag efflux pump CusA
VIQGERQFDLVVRMQEPYRSDENAIRNLLIATPDGQYLPLEPVRDVSVESGASFIYRESNRATSACSSAWRAATWPAPWARPARKWMRP